MENPRGVYGLTDPRNGHIRYVGMSEYIKYRYYDHCRVGSGRKGTPLGNWLKELFDIGLKPGLIILEEVPDKKGYRLGTTERFWIEYLRMLGAELTNRFNYGLDTRYNQDWYDKYMTSKGLPLRPYKKKAA